MDKKQSSVNLSKALDALGFSYDCIKHRQKSWEMCGENVLNQSNNIEDNISFYGREQSRGIKSIVGGGYGYNAFTE